MVFVQFKSSIEAKKNISTSDGRDESRGNNCKWKKLYWKPTCDQKKIENNGFHARDKPILEERHLVLNREKASPEWGSQNIRQFIMRTIYETIIYYLLSVRWGMVFVHNGIPTAYLTLHFWQET